MWYSVILVFYIASLIPKNGTSRDLFPFFDLQSQDLTYKSIFYYLLLFFSKSYWNVENKTVSQKNVPVFNQLVDLNNVVLLEHKAL